MPVILNEVKNLTQSVILNGVKDLRSSFAFAQDKLRLTPQNDITKQSLMQRKVKEEGPKIDRGRFMKPYSTIMVALILVVFVCFSSAFPQAETKEMLQKDEETSSQKKSEGARLKNPFLLPPGIYFLSKEGVGSVRKEKTTGTDAKLEEIETSPFKVRAILISDQIRLATIGPHIVAVGDKLNGETILEIKNDRVILGKGDRKRTLHLHQSPVQLTIEEKK
jgi:hypothetical protein